VKRRRRPRLYFSLRSPYSWMAVRRLRRAVPDAFDQFDWMPYWEPDSRTEKGLAERGAEFHYTRMSRAKHFYILMDTKRLAQEAGLSMAWPVDVDPWWELPHLAWLRARKLGRAAEFYDALTAARWGRGVDICTGEVVRAAAVEAGVEPELALAAPDDPALRSEGLDALVSAYENDIFGVPYLLWGPHRFWGLDRVDTFLRMWHTDTAAPPAGAAEAPDRPAPYDTDTAGGCG
jgi:2-hydroxychromene-2-carboxylate isomerase